MSKSLSHWLYPDQNYQLVDAALLLAGIDPYLVGKNPSFYSDDANELLKRAEEQRLDGWEKAFCFYSLIILAVRRGVIDDLGTGIVTFDSLVDFFKCNDIKEFPKGCPLSDANIKSNGTDDATSNTRQTYLSIIGALVTVLAELDESKERPLKNRRLIRADGISAKAIADVISTRFEGSNLPLKRSNTAISEALKLIEAAEKACV